CGGDAGVGTTHGAIADARAACCTTVEVVECYKIRLRGAALRSYWENDEIVGAARSLRYVKAEFRGVHARRSACRAEVDAPVAVQRGRHGPRTWPRPGNRRERWKSAVRTGRTRPPTENGAWIGTR